MICNILFFLFTNSFYFRFLLLLFFVPSEGGGVQKKRKVRANTERSDFAGGPGGGSPPVNAGGVRGGAAAPPDVLPRSKPNQAEFVRFLFSGYVLKTLVKNTTVCEPNVRQRVSGAPKMKSAKGLWQTSSGSFKRFSNIQGYFKRLSGTSEGSAKPQTGLRSPKQASLKLSQRDPNQQKITNI